MYVCVSSLCDERRECWDCPEVFIYLVSEPVHWTQSSWESLIKNFQRSASPSIYSRPQRLKISWFLMYFTTHLSLRCIPKFPRRVNASCLQLVYLIYIANLSSMISSLEFIGTTSYTYSLTPQSSICTITRCKSYRIFTRNLAMLSEIGWKCSPRLDVDTREEFG